MPAWLIPTLKAIAPHIGTIISAAKPVFTKKSAGTEANQTQLLQQQITELQTAAAANADHIKELAAQLQSAVAALEQGAEIAERKLALALRLCIVATVVSVVSIGAVTMLLIAR